MSFPSRLLFYLFVIESSSSRPMGCPGRGRCCCCPGPQSPTHSARTGYLRRTLPCPFHVQVEKRGGYECLAGRFSNTWAWWLCSPRCPGIRVENSSDHCRQRAPTWAWECGAPWLPWQRRDVVLKRGLMGSVVLFASQFTGCQKEYGMVRVLVHLESKLERFFFFRFVFISTECQLHARGLCSLVLTFVPSLSPWFGSRSWNSVELLPNNLLDEDKLSN